MMDSEGPAQLERVLDGKKALNERKPAQVERAVPLPDSIMHPEPRFPHSSSVQPATCCTISCGPVLARSSVSFRQACVTRPGCELYRGACPARKQQFPTI